jgi:hypothetical protein
MSIHQSAPLTSVNPDVSGISEQTKSLAKRLAGHMGLDAAIQISSENQWHGVVSVLEEMKKRERGSAI